MTTSVSNDDVSIVVTPVAPLAATTSQDRAVYRIRHTLASRFAFLVICIGIVMSALAYGTVHYWALGLFNLGGLTLLILWVVDAWQLGNMRVSRNVLQLPLLGALGLGLVQLLPLRDVATDAALAIGFSNTLSFDPYATRLVLVQLATLLIYFSATLVFVDTPHRLHVMVRTIMIFGFCLALFGMTQSFTSPTKVYWMRELNQSTAFGPFINRHHFAGYMELTIALPLGLLFAGAVEREKKILFIFIAGLMGVALVMTASRGGIISLVAEVIFLALVTAIWRKPSEERHRRSNRLKNVAVRAGLAAALLVSLFIGVLALGGEMSINRLIVDSVNTNDPTTGRAHFWSVTLEIIKAHPLLGTGLGAFGVVYTRFDSRNGLFRLEQAHNDYLQVLSDGGIIGAAIALAFVGLLFYRGFVRARSRDDFRRGVALASLGGCFAVLVHSFFDFTLHTTSNALLFLVLAALATLNGRVEDAPRSSSRRRRRKSSSSNDKSELLV
ncbi:MAG TPA: O-antigen ligase family protein [Pyrinomonadaceae bacterium]|nr:O-antigen ligase family protein [Pyrinomonadaceae bacterium]